MTRPLYPETGTTIASFHAMAAARGDGLHPRLLEVFQKTGPVSGPPAPSEQTDENVVSVDFGNRAGSPATKREVAT